MKIKSIVTAGVVAASLMAAQAGSALQVNSGVAGKGAANFLSLLDNKTDGYIRILHANSKTEFDTMFFEAFLNQTANLEQKLDVLIAEMRENNRLMKAQLAKK